MKRLVHILILVVAPLAHPTFAITPHSSELDQAHRFAVASFLAKSIEPAREAGLLVLDNHGPVQRNARGTEPLKIGAKTYTDGLYCHATSKVVVRLPSPGKSFHAEAGVDARAGGGSIEFVVRAKNKELFRSGVMKIDTPAKAINAPLDGATEFTLEITDAGDGISSDQGDWADASVTLTDGSQIHLGDLPILNAPAAAFATTLPISFTFDGKSSSELLPTWTIDRQSADAPGGRTYRVTATDPKSKFSVICSAIEYADSPTVDWTIHFKNDGDADSPIIEAIRAIDASLASGATALHYNDGDNAIPESYAVRTDAIAAGYSKKIANTGGRPTQIAFPYWNFTGPSEGAIVALGWPGQWSAEWSREESNTSAPSIRLRAGQELTHFRLHPGEQIRGPRVVVQFYSGDWIRGQNLWRRWMVAHNMPHPGGKPPPPMNTLCTGNFYPGLMSNAKQELEFLRDHIAGGMTFDAWWQDAGWYPCDGVTWPKTGTWEVDRGRFPNGLREVSDYVHQQKMKSIVWFEPERVYEGTWLADNHPEWIHGGKKGGLLRLDDEKCRAWLNEKIDKLLIDEAIDVYRQDFNIDPLSYWRSADAPDRQGVTEAKHIEGYLAFFDELERRHPNLFIDSCSSGGRRNDLETLKRAVPLLRSDWYNGAAGQQAHTYGLALWFPYQGTGALYGRDAYWIRSSMVAELTMGPGGEGMKNADLKLLKQMADEHRQIGDLFLADFYPLTPYSLDESVWMAWQYDNPETGKGAVQIFRREQSIYETAHLPLRGLTPDATYVFTNLDTHETTKMRGSSAMKEGIPIGIAARPGAAVVSYQRE